MCEVIFSNIEIIAFQIFGKVISPYLQSFLMRLKFHIDRGKFIYVARQRESTWHVLTGHDTHSINDYSDIYFVLQKKHLDQKLKGGKYNPVQLSHNLKLFLLILVSFHRHNLV